MLTPAALNPNVDVRRIDLGGGAWVDIARSFIFDPEEVTEHLLREVSWREGQVFRYEVRKTEPRLGGTVDPQHLHPAIQATDQWLRNRYRVTFDPVVFAQYRHGDDRIALHRDREMRWLDNTLIVVLTFGATRPWLIEPLQRHQRQHPEFQRVDLRPASGDLIVLGGACQRLWRHGIPPVPGLTEPRISAQWRWTSRQGEPDLEPGYNDPRFFNRADSTS